MGAPASPAQAALLINGKTLQGRLVVSGQRQMLRRTENTPERSFEYVLIDFGEACMPVELWLAVDEERPVARSVEVAGAP